MGLIALLCISHLFAVAQSKSSTSLYPDNIKFKLYGIPEGLSQSSAIDIDIDRNGFIWIGTQDGLNRFDGNEFVIFRHDPSDSTSISANRIRAIDHDGLDRLWVATLTGGLSILDKSTGHFTHIKADDHSNPGLRSNNVTAIAPLGDNQMWVGTDNGLNLIDVSTLNVSQVDPLIRSNLEKSSIRVILPVSDKEVWIGTANGLIRHDPTTNSSQLYAHSSLHHQISDNVINDVIIKDRSHIWVATNNGLNCIKPDGTIDQAARVHPLPRHGDIDQDPLLPG